MFSTSPMDTWLPIGAVERDTGIGRDTSSQATLTAMKI